MRKRYRILTLILTIMLSLGMSVMSVNAASIDVQNVLDGETYTAYKILNYTTNSDKTAYSYYLTAEQYASIGSALETAGFAFTQSSDGTRYTVNNAETVDVAAAAESLAGANLGNALGKYTAVGEDGEVVFENLPVGYYFVTTTAGSLCALHSEGAIAKAVEKNTVPSVDKTQATSATGTYTNDTLDFNIGDTVYYQLEVKDGKGTNHDIVLTDVMTSGLTFDPDSITVEKGGETVATSNYSVTDKSATGFKLTLNAAYVATLNENDTVVVKFTAKINTNAVIDSDTNTNTVTLKYSEQSSTKTVKLETYDFQLFKTDGTNYLPGSGFKLYDASTNGNQIKLSKDSTGYYKDASGSAEIMVDSANGVNVRGLAPGTYYLEETTVPDGYNAPAARIEVTISSGQTVDDRPDVTVVNEAGTELPTTGGMGTTIIYIIGGLLIALCAVVLIARRRANNR